MMKVRFQRPCQIEGISFCVVESADVFQDPRSVVEYCASHSYSLFIGDDEFKTGVLIEAVMQFATQFLLDIPAVKIAPGTDVRFTVSSVEGPNPTENLRFLYGGKELPGGYYVPIKTAKL